MKRTAIPICILILGALSAPGETLFQDTFDKGAGAWTATNQASVSEISRRPGTKSLLIRQNTDEEQTSAWVSPAIKSPGKPVKISFWAADNYFKLTDFSYAACVDVLSYDQAGKEVEATSYLKSMPWDQGRKEDLWGQFLPEGLVWKYYEAVHAPRGETFKLTFHWPKPIVRGECYLTDVMVTVATPEEIAAAAPGVKKETTAAPGRLALEVSTPVLGNIFYADDPLQFDALLFTTDGKEIGVLNGATLRYEITDFERFFVARGEMAFDKAKPVADAKFAKSAPGTPRAFNLHQALPVGDVAARQTGREFFIRVELVSGGTVVAADTVTYGVMAPRTIDPKDYGKCRFSSTFFAESFKYAESKHEKQSISAKTGISRMHLIDYYWNRCQPTYPGPITFKSKLPAFPPVISCPNLEQERSSDEWLKKMAPPECLIPDPLRPGRLTFKIEPYVEYIVAYVRHNREAIVGVIPSGLERPIDARTVELHKRAYTAIKKEWPELPVGMMLYGLPMNPSSDVDLFLKEQLYDYADFLDTHIYAASVDWTEWQRLQGAYRKMKRNPPPLISTEFCRVGGSDQVLHSRDTIAAHLDAFANGMEHIYYFNQCNEGGNLFLRHPFLREPTDLGGDQTSGFMYLQRVDRPRVSDAMVFADSATRWNRSSWGHESGGDTLMPVLQAMTYYNLVQNFELAEYRATFNPSENTVAYLFDRGAQTVCAVWLAKPMPVETLVIRGDTPYTVQDLFGRTERIVPVGGASLVSVDENPLTLVFDRKMVVFDTKTQRRDVEVIAGGVALGPVARGNEGKATITVPPVFKTEVTARVSATVDGTWPPAADKTLSLKPGAAATAELSLAVANDRAPGSYPLTVRLRVGDQLAGLLRAPLQVDELLKLSVTAIPATPRQEPAIEVTVTSLRDQPSKGQLRLLEPFLAAETRAVPQLLSYAVPPRASASVRFPVKRERINLSTAYDVEVELRDDSGLVLTRGEEVAFRATRRAPGKIVVDGKLDDWQLADQPAIPLSRQFTAWGKPWGGPQDISGVFYTLWDDERIYIAAVIKDNSHVTRANDVDIWQDDNILVGLYPWGWNQGETLKSGYYREHLGFCKDGKARIFRVGNVAVGPATAEGADIAVVRTQDGYVYEWSYPKACVAPLRLEAGARFRLSLFVWDTDETGDPKTPYSRLGGIHFGGFNANIDARPVKWREFVLTD